MIAFYPHNEMGKVESGFYYLQFINKESERWTYKRTASKERVHFPPSQSS